VSEAVSERVSEGVGRELKDERDQDINLILFMFFGLAVGASITLLLNRFSSLGLPYTVGVFITGALLSVIADHTEFLGDLGE
jgi:Na+/glutamate symporter